MNMSRVRKSEKRNGIIHQFSPEKNKFKKSVPEQTI